LGLDPAPEAIGVVAFVGVDQDVGREMAQKPFARPAIGDLTAGEDKRTRPADAVGQGMDLRRPSAARTADGLAPFPPLPPLAHRCALTAEESSRTAAGGPPAAARV